MAPPLITDLFDLPDLDEPGPVAEVVTYPSIQTTGEGHVLRLSDVFGGSCRASEVLDVCGNGRTGREGTTTIAVEDYLCPTALGRSPSPLTPAYFVATARTSQPRTITFEYVARNAPSDRFGFDIAVSSWDPSGAPAPLVAFQWRFCSLADLPSEIE